MLVCEDKKLGLVPDQLDLELVTVHLGKVEESSQLLKVIADESNIICLAYTTDHISF